MKKSLIWILAVCLLLECFMGISLADSASDNSATSGVDVIVVMDMSGSMTSLGTNKPGNDVNKFRIDATAMLMGMMDMDGSRIGIVTFAGKVLTEGVRELRAVNNSVSRDSFISDLYGNISKIHGDDTNTGAALMTALYMLDTREDKSNRPMIVLLTDGKNAINNPAAVTPSYRWENNEIVNKNREVFDTALTNTVTKEAAECAVAKGVPIYTVSLTLDPYAPTQGLNLSSLSELTGVRDGCWWAKTKENAKDIPTYFAKILADKIGSSVQIITKPRLVEGTQKTYEVSIPVLNESIREINVILPVKKGNSKLLSSIDGKTIKVLNKNGELQTEGNGVTILRNDNGFFAMIKIRKPVRGSMGMWKLQFDSDNDPENISFNFLYNYNIKLNATAVSTDRPEDDQLFKTDRLTLNAFFTEDNGARSDDAALYADHTGEADYEEWMTIRASWQLFEVDGDGRAAEQPVRAGTLDPQDSPLCFATEIDLKDNSLKSGQYNLVFTADGAGLLRKVELPITLRNHRPNAAASYPYSITVNSTIVGQEETWTVEGSSGVLPEKAGEIVTDEDPEDQANMRFTLVPESGVDQAATLTLEDDGTIRYTTILDGDAIKDGEAKYRLNYDDGDQDGQGTVNITLDVISDLIVKTRDLEPELTVDGDHAPGSKPDSLIFRKNKPLHVRLQLKKKDGSGYADGSMLEQFANRLIIEDQKTGETAVQNTEFTLNGDALEYTLESTGNKGEAWRVTADVGPFKGLTEDFRISDQFDPEAKAAESITLNCSGDRVPGFLKAFIGDDTAEDDPIRQIRVPSLFTDDDNDDLKFSEPVFKTQDGAELMDPESITAVPQGDEENREYLIRATGAPTSVFSYSYQCRLEITATDGDGRQATYEQEITVVDLFNKLLTYVIIILIAIVILVIAILIIHQIRKPRFPKLNLTIREEPCLYESGSETLSPVKTPTNVNAMGVDSDMAAKHNVSMELLQNIVIKPIRSILAVGLICKKSISGQEVLLDDVRLKPRKLYTWKIGQELSIQSTHGEGIIVIKLEKCEETDGDDGMDDFGGSDDWANAGTEGTSGTAGKKRTRKVERKAKAAEEKTDTTPNDDFDF